MSFTNLGLLILASGLFTALIQSLIAEARLRKKLRRYDSLDDKEAYQRQLESNINLKKLELSELETIIKERHKELQQLDTKIYLHTQDAYEPQYDFIKSEDYLIQLENIKLQQERMLNNNQAFVSRGQMSINGNEKEGEQLRKNFIKLIKIAFETQCDYAIRDVKYSNIESLKKKITDTFTKINKLTSKTKCEIGKEYLDLKLKQLDLKYELEQKRKEEREQEQEIKKQARERKKIDEARQRAEEAEEREKFHLQELDKVRQEIEQAKDEEQKQLELRIQELEKLLAEDINDKEYAISESRRLKSGYIYIVSNIGSMDRDIYRICMTSRGDEYIKEMNPNVPFQFDIHFKIYSEDASDTLQRLHQRFDDKRVNLVNSRRDFFKVSIDEIEQAVKEIKKKTGFLRIDVFEQMPQAYEYRQTLALRKKNQQANASNTFSEMNEIA